MRLVNPREVNGMSNISSHQVDLAVEQVLAEVTACVQQVSGDGLAEAGDLIASAPRIFVDGAGRSGLCMRAFAIRLMHLGKVVYVVGESTTPGIKSTDLLILGSGSGQSPVLMKIAEIAREHGARILLFTAEAISPLTALADHCVSIPAPSLKPALEDRDYASMQPMGTLFEQALLILSDSLVITLMDNIGVGVGKMRMHHANLE
jgi:6-phospho-3-hexuloisomerase